MYQALYRKWRPLSFDDVVSQKHITATLKNQIINNKTAHAYLFTGTRGTGKTTCARIFAKAINCQNSIDGNPCLACQTCKDAEAMALSDIIEIDAASNTGVDDMRDLRDGAIFTPESCRFKVYIIDEVHMLSINAFNALLKIMEEPPSFVKFILATTEVHKVPATILSRCQRFDFCRIIASDITSRLLYVSDKEGIVIDKQAAELIGRVADGGMRDALSLLDQCMAFSNGDNITLETVSAAAGIAGRDYLFDLVDSIADDDLNRSITVISTLYEQSKDISRLCEELILQLRNLMLVKSTQGSSDLFCLLPDEYQRLKNISEKLDLQSIIAKLTAMQACNERLSRSPVKRVEFEMCLVKMANSKKVVDNSEFCAKIKKLEEKINLLSITGFGNEEVVQNTSPNNAGNSSDMISNDNKVREVGNAPEQLAQILPNNNAAAAAPIADLSKLKAEDFKALPNWTDILDEVDKIQPGVSGSLRNSHAYINGNVMLINAENAFFLKLFKIRENAEALGEAVRIVLGQQYIIRAKCSTSEAETKKEEHNAVKELLDRAKKNNISIENE